MDPAKERYINGEYKISDLDGEWKAKKIIQMIEGIDKRSSITKYADIGCGQGSVCANIIRLMPKDINLEVIDGYDISPSSDDTKNNNPKINFITGDFITINNNKYDLITLNDVIEHVTQPQEFLKAISSRSRYVILHIPLDDRLSVLISNQYNYRLQVVGHINFWNPSSAINLLTSAGLLPLKISFTPGFLAPSGRERLIQFAILPFRYISYVLMGPGLTARLLGGVSMCVLCRGNVE